MVYRQASATRFNARMRPAGARTKLQVQADRRAEEGLRALGTEMRRLREDAGLPKAVIARVAGIHPTHLRLIEDGQRDASTSVLARIAAALGADFSRRLFPTGGPPIRDRFQARMVEAFLRELPPYWSRSVEVAVHRPVRGVIDAVLGDPAGRHVVALECQSELRRLEQQLRWALAKSEALPSSAVWPILAPDPAAPPAISSILLLRSTTATRELARTFRATLAAAYPAGPADLQQALVDPNVAWPGSGIIWVRLDGTSATILPGWPRGVGPH
jgi:transcriptional regulator with XRE-family HTH domain